jgi:DNA-binding HxlR family transcriptional regulator
MRLLGHRGRSWIPAVLISLSAAPVRYSDLLERINDLEVRWGASGQGRPLSDKVLWQTMNRMLRDGLVVRHRTQEYPPSAFYELTPQARSLLAALRPLAQWVQSYRVAAPGLAPGARERDR